MTPSSDPPKRIDGQQAALSPANWVPYTCPDGSWSLYYPPGWDVAERGLQKAIFRCGEGHSIAVTLQQGGALLYENAPEGNLRQLVDATAVVWQAKGSYHMQSAYIWHGSVYNGYCCCGRIRLRGQEGYPGLRYALPPQAPRAVIMHLELVAGRDLIVVLSVQRIGPGEGSANWELPEALADTIRVSG